MISDVYRTIALKNYNLNIIDERLKIELVRFDNITNLILEDSVVKGVVLLTREASDIPSLSHPLIVDSQVEPYVVIGGR